jgi:thiamine biosynthesis lipoprotein
MKNSLTWGWYGLCFRAMNTDVEVQLYTNDHGRALEEVQRMVHKAEKHFTRFEPYSELCQLNASAGYPRRVSSLLFDVVDTAVWAASATQGLFDPGLLPVMEAIGYDRSFEQIAQDDQAGPTWAAPGWRGSEGIQLNRSRREITLPPGVQLDLGGIGKGWTVDRVADWLAGKGPFLINAGGDLYAYGAPPGRSGWSIGIADPREPSRDITRLHVQQRAVATSTVSRRRWRRGGQLMHHLIDPRSGQPAETDAVSVTVIAHRVALAEVYAKTALILGVEAGRDWLNSIPNTEGLLIRDDGQLITTDGLSSYCEVTHDDSITSQTHNGSPGRPATLWHRRDSRHRGRPALAGAGAGQLDA